MTDRIYNSMTNLSSEEIPYKIYLDRLLNEFDQKDYDRIGLQIQFDLKVVFTQLIIYFRK